MSTSRNPLQIAWSEDRATVGAWCEIPSVAAADVVAHAGFDWACVDWQHSPVGVESTSAVCHALAAAGVVPLVRVPSHDPASIGLALDVGAVGVVVPTVEDAGQAAAAVAACRYPPTGRRSIGPFHTLAATGLRTDETNAFTLCVVMIETAAGLENAEAICRTPGLDCVFVGPGDLQLSLGRPVLESLPPAIATSIAEACRRNGVASGIYAGSGAEARRWIEAGFRFVAVGTDRQFLFAAATAEVEHALGERALGKKRERIDLLPAVPGLLASEPPTSTPRGG